MSAAWYFFTASSKIISGALTAVRPTCRLRIDKVKIKFLVQEKVLSKNRRDFSLVSEKQMVYLRIVFNLN